MFLFTTYLLSNVFAKTECETGTHMFNEECLPGKWEKYEYNDTDFIEKSKMLKYQNECFFIN